MPEPSVSAVCCECRKNLLLKLLFWCDLVVGIVLFIWGIWALFAIASYYPPTTNIFGAVMIGFVAFLVALLLWPMSNVIISCETKKTWPHVLFMVCCVILLILPCPGFALLEPYAESGFVREEYIQETALAFNSSDSDTRIPSWVGHPGRNGVEGCCGYYGPYDIGTIFTDQDGEKFTESKDKDCFGATENEDGNPEVKEVPTGCQKTIKGNVKKVAEGLFITYIITMFFTLLTLVVHIKYSYFGAAPVRNS